MNTKTSVLKAIIEKVYVAKTFEEGMTILKEHLNDPQCVIRPAEGRVIIIKAQMCLSLPKLQQYLTNSWFKFEGMGV